MDQPNRYYINTCSVCNDMHICDCTIFEESDYGFFCDIDEDFVAVPVKHPNGFSVRSIMKKYIHKNGSVSKERRTRREPIMKESAENPIKYAIYPDNFKDKKMDYFKMIKTFDEMPVSMTQFTFGCIYAAVLFMVLF